VVRTFQTAQLFPDLSAADNVAVAVAGPRLGSLLASLIATPGARRREAALRQGALARLTHAGLGPWAEAPGDALPSGLRRRVEIARALATAPRVLMLDEPAAGLGPAEIEDLAAHLAGLRDGGGPALVLVEHHMDLVMEVSNHITVLDDGRVIASGPPAAVRDDPAVVEAYLGTAP
jgi:branched-chain amino acid transport system ATP-binding protein